MAKNGIMEIEEVVEKETLQTSLSTEDLENIVSTLGRLEECEAVVTSAISKC